MTHHRFALRACFVESLRIGVGGCCIALALAGASGAQQPARQAVTIATRQAVVPPVTGISVDSARHVLAAFKLTPSVDPSIAGTAFVRAQTPAAGEAIPADRIVRLSIRPLRAPAALSGIAGIPSGPSGTRIPPAVQKVVVPPVVGTSTLVANRLLNAVALSMAARDTLVTTANSGIVLSQDPAAGDSAAPGSIVTVVVAKPIPLVVVPDVTQMPLTRAATTLRRAGLTLGAVARRPSPQDSGTVLSQLPQNGDSVARRTPVALEVAVPQARTVPSVIGLSKDDAQRKLADEGIKIGSVDSRVSRDSVGLVVAQTPGAGQALTAAAEAALTLGAQPQIPVSDTAHAKKPDSVDVPDVRGRTLSDARKTLASVRLRVRVAGGANNSDTVDTETPVNVRRPINTIVAITVKRHVATTTVTGNQSAGTTRLEQPPSSLPRTRGESGPVVPSSRFPVWTLILAGLVVIGVAGILWLRFRVPTGVSQTVPHPESTSAHDGSEEGLTPRLTTRLGRGSAQDNAESMEQPLIAQALEFVPQAVITTSEIVGLPPTLQLIHQEG